MPDTLDDRLAMLAQRLVTDAPPAPRFAEIERRRPPRRIGAQAPLFAVAAAVALIVGLVTVIGGQSGGTTEFSLAFLGRPAGASLADPVPIYPYPSFVPEGLRRESSEARTLPVTADVGPAVVVLTGRRVKGSTWTDLVLLAVTAKRSEPQRSSPSFTASERVVAGRTVAVESPFPGYRQMIWSESGVWFTLSGAADDAEAVGVVEAVRVGEDRQLRLDLPDGREVVDSAVRESIAGTFIASLGFVDSGASGVTRLEAGAQTTAGSGGFAGWGGGPFIAEFEPTRFRGHPAAWIRFEPPPENGTGAATVLMWSPQPGQFLYVAGDFERATLERIADSMEFLSEAEWRQRTGATGSGG